MPETQNTRRTRAAAARAYAASLAGLLDALEGRTARGRVAAAGALRDACRARRVDDGAVLGSVETAGTALARMVRRGGAERAAALDALAALALCAGPARGLCATALGACVAAGTGAALRTAALVCAACSEDRDTTHECADAVARVLAAAHTRAVPADTLAGAVAAWTLLHSVVDARAPTHAAGARALWHVLQHHCSAPEDATAATAATAKASSGAARELAEALADALLLLEEAGGGVVAACADVPEEVVAAALHTLADRWPGCAARVACVLAHRGADAALLEARARGLPPGVVLRGWRGAVRAAALLRALQPGGLAHHVRDNAVVREMLGLPPAPPPAPAPRARVVVDPSSAEARRATRSRAAQRDAKASSSFWGDDDDDNDF